ncbi:periplasmic copper chaperone A [Oryzomicrobium terrae]|jgi:copper(I)-binding protein|uniref:Periplasmic copper chaperone A n=1 Tax=Oryzomicrobium terrae TaxID=1735038 RepID=A0A5C1E9N1_9RHOO|nr:copper chaperone PCu(A)C [Oryzomicrobium terrae]QEL65573.1 periplasmic copper chaperone A [Oryzomicrobium terrae]
MRLLLTLLASGLTALSAASPAAFAADAAGLSVSAPFVRAVPPTQKVTGAFMTIKNAGSTDRKLVAAESPVAASVELHNHINDNGVMKMRPVKEIEVKAGGEAALKPGSYHIMLIDLKQPVKEGDQVPVTLKFDDGSTLKVEAPVQRPAPAAPMAPMSDHGHMKH